MNAISYRSSKPSRRPPFLVHNVTAAEEAIFARAEAATAKEDGDLGWLGMLACLASAIVAVSALWCLAVELGAAVSSVF